MISPLALSSYGSENPGRAVRGRPTFGELTSTRRRVLLMRTLRGRHVGEL